MVETHPTAASPTDQAVDQTGRLVEFRLPDLGEGLTEAEVQSWAVAVGDEVSLNQPLAEVETAKALVALPSPFAGTVVELAAQAGDTVAVGAPLVRLRVAGSEREGNAVLVGFGPDEEQRPGRRRRAMVSGVAGSESGGRSISAGQSVTEDADTDGRQSDAAERSVPAGRRLATPGARKLASELNIPLASITGSGPNGAVTIDDIRAAGAARPTPAPGPAESCAAEERVRIGGVRKQTATAMITSAQTIPQASTSVTVDVTPTMDLLPELQQTPALAETRVTFLALLAKAVLVALDQFPVLNGFWDAAAGEMVVRRPVNLGIAVAAPRGLLVPNLKGAQHFTLRQLCSGIAEIVTTARAGQATPEQLRDATFTISNIGVFGVDSATALVNPGQAAIVAVGAVARRPWVYRDELAIRQVVTLTVSFDHRMIDGDTAARFLATLAGYLRQPSTLLAAL